MEIDRSRAASAGYTDGPDTRILAALVRETGLFTHAISTLITTLTQTRR